MVTTPKRIPLKHVEDHERHEFRKHVCPPTFGGPTPDRVEPTREIERNLLHTHDHKLLDGSEIRMWIIEDPVGRDPRRSFPSPLIRTVAGDVVHARVGASKNTHTIHWHGIDPSPMNDGVGKTSFEVSGNFTYQFATHQAGTFFYHCHKNTVLHFEMGMYGLLIVDPPRPDVPEAADVPEPPYPTGGPGFVAAQNPPAHVRKYDIEALWAADEMDSKWRRLNHNASMQACSLADPVREGSFTQDGILHDFRPDVFVITGQGVRAKGPDDSFTIEEVAVHAGLGDTILLRLLAAGYTTHHWRIGLPAEIVAMDGYPLGVPPVTPYSSPIRLAAGEPLVLTSAMRNDLLVEATQRGSFPVDVEFHHWISGKRLFTARTFIHVS